MTTLKNKVTIVTGGGTGIGKGIALAFAREGARLVLASRGAKNLEATAAEARALGAVEAVAIPTDVTREESVLALFAETQRRFGRLDIVISNAGAFDGGPLEELSLETWQKVVDVNLTGSFLCCREAMKIMKPQGGGRIIIVGSISAQMARENNTPYTTTKHGLTGLTKSVALEGRPFGVTASAVHPGNVLTEWRMDDSVPMHQEPMMAADQVAKVVVTMASLDPDVNLLEAIVLPAEQKYLGRG